jgi:hypothetical protein
MDESDEDKVLYTIFDTTLNNSNYIKLPESFLSDLQEEELPFYFKLTTHEGLYTYVGVKEFTADDNTINIPYWIKEMLMLEEETLIKINLEKDIKKGKLIDFQPLSEDFFEIPNYDDYLTIILSNYCLLSNDTTLSLDILDKNYKVLISNVEIDWEKVDMDNLQGEINDEVIDIKDIDLKVNIINTFLKEESEAETTDDGDNEEIQEEPILEEPREVIPVDIDMVRKARLAFFKN